MEQGPERISTTEAVKDQIAKAQTPEQLFTALGWYDRMKGAIPDEVLDYSVEEVIGIIQEVFKKRERGKQITEQDLLPITHKLGIRDAVMRILNIEGLKEAAAA